MEYIDANVLVSSLYTDVTKVIILGGGVILKFKDGRRTEFTYDGIFHYSKEGIKTKCGGM